MLLTRDGKPFASSPTAGFIAGFVISTAGAYRAWDIDTPHRGRYLWMVAAPMIAGLGLALVRSWRDFAIGMVAASVAVSILGVAMLYLALANLPYS